MKTDNTTQASAGIQGPAWDLSAEYQSFEAAGFLADWKAVETALEVLAGRGARIGQRIPDAATLNASTETELLQDCRHFAVELEQVSTLLSNLMVYVNCMASTDGFNSQAKQLKGRLDTLGSQLGALSASYELLMKLAPQDFYDAFCAFDDTAAFRFALGQIRKLKDLALPLEVEKTLSTMSPAGFTAWGNLYNNLTGTIRCTVQQPDGKESVMGLAGASAVLKQADRPARESAWRAINAQMAGNQEAFAAILNSLSGWRLAEYKQRSHTRKLHFLDSALFQSRISQTTLETLLAVLAEGRELGRHALRLQAGAYGCERLGPWDILAPAPQASAAADGGESTNGIPFDQGLELVRRAYAAVDPAMGDFVSSMQAKRRIEGRVLDGKRPGAYCTGFTKSRNRYVFTTYKGSLSELSTLSHELGHAYHGEVMRSLPLAESRYPMTLAETASTFAEAALGDLLAAEATDKSALLELAWADAQDAAVFLVNIPARFAFEKSLYEARENGPLPADRMCSLMTSAWQEWYGDALSEYDSYYWASKLHFAMPGVSFYNFPYSFGYLFSLGVFARRASLGDGFHQAYVSLLRDTGRMEVEELAQKHLGVDISRPDFWRESLGIVRQKVERFEALLKG